MEDNNLQDLKNEKIVIEIRQLIAGIDTVKAEVDDYCEFMREMFLNTSGRN